MEPTTAMLALSALMQGAGAAFGGQQTMDPKNAADLHLVNAGQQELYNAMLRNYMKGAGDFGMGRNVKAGKSQLAQMMANRGISPQSGIGSALFAQMVGSAGAQANQNRQNFGMNLLRSPLQVAQTAGSNWLPASPSMGYGPSEQWRQQARNQERYLNAYGAPFMRER
jgi:hypothetical protein